MVASYPIIISLQLPSQSAQVLRSWDKSVNEYGNMMLNQILITHKYLGLKVTQFPVDTRLLPALHLEYDTRSNAGMLLKVLCANIGFNLSFKY